MDESPRCETCGRPCPSHVIVGKRTYCYPCYDQDYFEHLIEEYETWASQNLDPELEEWSR